MLRLSSVAARRLVGRSEALRTGVRHASSGGGGGGLGKVLAGTVMFTTGVGGGVLGYAALDPDFRKTLEAGLPGSEDVLNMILGSASPPAPVVTKPVPSKLRIPGPVVVTKPKDEASKLEESKVPESISKLPETIPEVSISAPPLPELETPPPVLAPSPPAIEPPVVESPPTPEPEPEPEPVPAPVKKVEKITLNEELSPDVENSSLEQVLIELSKEMNSATGVAVEGYNLSSEAVVSHINIMQKVLESNLAARDDNAWNQVFEAATIKSDALKFAEMKEKEAIASINNVLESIDAGRKNKATATNPQLIVAEEAANRAMYQLEQARARIAAVEGEARVVEQYRDLVEEGRQQFHQEMASIMPDVKLGEKNSKLTEDELNMFITHAYRKVLHLQQELAKQQTLEQQRFKTALEKQRMEAQMSASNKIDNELERQKRELEVEHQRRLAGIKEDSESELRTQLRRQAAAHSDHLADVLTVQEAELRRKHEHDLDEKLASAQSKYLSQVSALSGGLQGLSAALEARAEGDKASVSAQKLWLACVELEGAIKSGNVNAETFGESFKPLSAEIATIKNIAGENPFVNTVVSSIPGEALTRGVYTEQGLRDRFVRVEEVARKVGSIGDEGGSLLRYGLSYLQSKLLVDTATRTPGGSNELIDISELTAGDILTLTRHSLERGDLIQAVQYMGLLRGEPRRVVSDWMDEARLHLEAKQASQALLAHAASVGLEVLPK